MYSMLLAAGLTDDRTLLCSLIHSSMNFPSVISGSETEHPAESRIIQAHSNAATVLPMLLGIKMPPTQAPKLWFVKYSFNCQTSRGNYTQRRNRMCSTYVLFLKGYRQFPPSAFLKMKNGENLTNIFPHQAHNEVSHQHITLANSYSN